MVVSRALAGAEGWVESAIAAVVVGVRDKNDARFWPVPGNSANAETPVYARPVMDSFFSHTIDESRDADGIVLY